MLHSFLINFFAHLFVDGVGSANAADPALASVLVVVQPQAYILRGFQEGHRIRVIAVNQRPQFRTGGELSGSASLLGKQNSLIQFGETIEHFAADGQVLTAVAELPGGNSVLTVKNIVVTVTEADLRVIGDMLVKFCRDLADTVGIQFPLVSVTRDFQVLAVDHHLVKGAVNQVLHVDSSCSIF